MENDGIYGGNRVNDSGGSAQHTHQQPMPIIITNNIYNRQTATYSTATSTIISSSTANSSSKQKENGSK